MDPLAADLQRAPGIRSWHLTERCKKAVEGLRRRGFDAQLAKDKREALEILLRAVPGHARIAFGGSITLSEIGAIDALKSRGNPFLTLPEAQGEERLAQRRAGLHADFYLTSVNALTLDGRLVSMDGTGNRVASMIFGPLNVVAVVGAQKITDTLDEAICRVRHHAAVMNAKRLQLKTPCAVTGVCSDCDSPDRICSALVILERKPSRTGFNVIVVAEPLGF